VKLSRWLFLDSTDQKQEEKSKKGNKEGGGMHHGKRLGRKHCNLIKFVKWQGRVTTLGVPPLCARQKMEGE